MEKIYTEEQLSKLHSILIMMMNEVKRICDKNNIKYFCMYGTLLGAVRHKGFIPWDDDFDIAMLRPDYEKFMKVAERDLSENMFIENYNSCKGYGHVFAKVMLKGTIWEEGFTEFVDCYKNVYIDVFPLDITTNNLLKRRIQFFENMLITKYLLLNCHYKFTKKGIKKVLYNIGYFTAGLIKKETLIKVWERNAFKYSKCKNGTYVNFSGVNWSLMKADFFEEELAEMVEVPFEDSRFVIPKGYDSILKKCYGNYMELPPKEQQVPKHGVVKMDFGDY